MEDCFDLLHHVAWNLFYYTRRLEASPLGHVGCLFSIRHSSGSSCDDGPKEFMESQVERATIRHCSICPYRIRSRYIIQDIRFHTRPDLPDLLRFRCKGFDSRMG